MSVFGATFINTVVLPQAFDYICGYAGIQAVVSAAQDVNNPCGLNGFLLIRTHPLTRIFPQKLHILPWMAGSRAMHMYRTFGSRVTHGAVTERYLVKSVLF